MILDLINETIYSFKKNTRFEISEIQLGIEIMKMLNYEYYRLSNNKERDFFSVISFLGIPIKINNSDYSISYILKQKQIEITE